MRYINLRLTYLQSGVIADPRTWASLDAEVAHDHHDVSKVLSYCYMYMYVLHAGHECQIFLKIFFLMCV